MKTVSVKDLASAIMEGLEEYKDLVAEDVKEAVKETADFVKKEIASTAPKRTGDYAKSWAVLKGPETANMAQFTVYSKRPHLPHLLEFGHQTRNGGRTKAQPHIAPAEEKGRKHLEQILKSKLGG